MSPSPHHFYVYTDKLLLGQVNCGREVSESWTSRYHKRMAVDCVGYWRFAIARADSVEDAAPEEAEALVDWIVWTGVFVSFQSCGSDGL